MKTSNSPHDFLLGLGSTLPGYLYLVGLNKRICFHNRAMEQYFAIEGNKTNDFAFGLNSEEVAHTLNQNHPQLAKRNASKLMGNNERALKERRSFVFEETFPINGIMSRTVSHKGPIFDANGYIIGLYGYSIDIDAYRDLPKAMEYIYHRAMHTLHTLNHPCDAMLGIQTHKVRSLLSIIECIEKNF